MTRKNLERMRVVWGVVVCLLLPASGYGAGTSPVEWVRIIGGVEGERPHLEASISDDEQTVVDITLPGLWTSQVTEEGETFDIVEIPGSALAGEPGQPQIPVVGTFVAIPPTSNVSLTVESTQCTTLTDYYLYPLQPRTLCGPDADTSWYFDDAFYSIDSFSPDQVAEISEPLLWQDCRVVRLLLYPVAFNPATRELKVCSSIRVRLDYSGVSDVNPQTLTRGTITPEQARAYEELIVNYSSLGLVEARGVARRYLIIADQYFAPYIEALRAWKHRKGTETAVAYLDIHMERDPVAIHDYIQDFFEDHVSDDIYVLLVGDPDLSDVHHLPMYVYSPYSDHYYSCVCGDDLIPDVRVGRLSPAQASAADDALIVQLLAGRMAAYQTDPVIDDPQQRYPWMKDYVLVCYPGFEYVKEYIRTTYLSLYDVVVDTLYGRSPNATNANLRAEIEAGTGILNYYGHGGRDKWWHWSYLDEDWAVDNSLALVNGGRRPPIFNHSCHTGEIQYDGLCLGESFMLALSGGMVGFGGCTTVEYVTPAIYYDRAMWEAAFPDNPNFSRLYITGDIQNFADAKLLAGGGYLEEFTVKEYIWLGDPELDIWTERPETLTVAHPTSIFDEPTIFQVTVRGEDGVTPVYGACVCLDKTNDIYEVDWTDASGQATFSIDPRLGTIFVTVTKHNYLPYRGSCQVHLGPHVIEVDKVKGAHVHP